MDRVVNWGILGTASTARRKFVPAAMKSGKANVVAIGSRSAETAKDFAQEFNIPDHFGSYQAVLDAPNVDAVYIPLPNAMHAEWTLKAADAGKHVLCEKPMAVDEREAAGVIAYQNTHPQVGCDMTTSAVMDFGGGRTSLINCSFETAFRSSVDVVGDKAVLKVDRFFSPAVDGKIESKPVFIDPYKDLVSNARVIDSLRRSAESNCFVELECAG